MRIKQRVDLRGLQPQMVLALIAADRVFACATHEMTVTSCTDGKHGPRSLHPSGNAVDIRTVRAGIDKGEATFLAHKIRAVLNDQFDVVVEKDHLHIEFDPKNPTKPGTV